MKQTLFFLAGQCRINDLLSYMKLLMTWFFMMGGDRLYGSIGMGPPATDANATA